MFPSCSVSEILLNIMNARVTITREHLCKLQNIATDNAMFRIRCYQRIVRKAWDIYSEDGKRLTLKLFEAALELKDILSIDPRETGKLTWRFACESQ